MSSDDPFANNDNDRTVIRPMPGGRRPAPETPVQPAPTPVQASPQVAPNVQPLPDYQSGSAHADSMASQAGQIIGSGMNFLVDAAGTLLMLGSQLRNSISQAGVPQLREQMIQQLRTFEDKARAGGGEQNTVLTARYLLCSYLDEAVLSTPWGSESGWANQSLLSTFHNETWGGEKFFQVLEQHAQSPSRSLNILELIFVCLAFGFQGKHQLSDRGNAQLITIQDNLFSTIAMQRGEFERDLSPHWHGVPDKRYALTRYVPLWVVAALAGVLLLVVYTGFRLIINTTTAPIYEEIDQIRQEQLRDLNQ